MTEKSISGQITIRADALRPELETTEIKANSAAEILWQSLAECSRHAYAIAITLLESSDASDETLRTVAELEEIVVNLKTRISPAAPNQTAMQRHG